MGPETRERLRECLDESDGRMAVDRLLQIVEEAAEEARASERERCAKVAESKINQPARTLTSGSSEHDARVIEAGAYRDAAWSIRHPEPAPPSPEPERAPLFPNASFGTQSGNLPPLGREPEALTERVRHIEEQHVKATLRAQALAERVEALERALENFVRVPLI